MKGANSQSCPTSDSCTLEKLRKYQIGIYWDSQFGCESVNGAWHEVGEKGKATTFCQNHGKLSEEKSSLAPHAASQLQT